MASSSVSQCTVTPEEIRFRWALNKQLLTTVSVVNDSAKRCGFKIKTTAPKKYVVRPSSGVVEAGATTTVQVIMQAQKEYPVDFANCKDKFMVQVTELGVDEEIDAATTFSKEVKGDALRESRLRVVLEGPAAPPSPVPEGEEAGAATDAGGGALKTAFTDLAATSQENNYLKSKVEKLKGECDTLRRQLDAMQLAGAGKASSPASAKAKVSLIHIIIAAILAFLIGHYLGNR